MTTFTKNTNWLSKIRTLKEAYNHCSQSIKTSIPTLKSFRVNTSELDTEIKLSICTKILSHQNIQHYLNKKTYRFLENKINSFVQFVKEGSLERDSLDKDFDLWIKSEQSNYAFSDHKKIIQQRAKLKLTKRSPASSD